MQSLIHSIESKRQFNLVLPPKPSPREIESAALKMYIVNFSIDSLIKMLQSTRVKLLGGYSIELTNTGPSAECFASTYSLYLELIGINSNFRQDPRTGVLSIIAK